MKTASLVIFAIAISVIICSGSSNFEEDERDRLLSIEKERVWPLLRGCCERSEVCPDKSDIRNYFKCKEELGRCMGIKIEDLEGDAVDGCDLIYAGSTK